MGSRRGFLALAGCALSTAAERPKLVFAAGPPAGGVVFGRAYTACPESTALTIQTGMFPHAGARESLERFFEPGRTNDPDAFVLYARGQRAPLRIELVLKSPRALRSLETDILVSTVDVMPTVMGLAGLAIPEGLHGRDLSGLLTTGKGEQPAAVFAEGALGRAEEWRAVIRGWDKLVTTRELEPRHLYNLREDPDEQEDLAKEPGHRLRVDELRALLLDWRRRVGDGVDQSGLKRR